MARKRKTPPGEQTGTRLSDDLSEVSTVITLPKITLEVEHLDEQTRVQVTRKQLTLLKRAARHGDCFVLAPADLETARSLASDGLPVDLSEPDARGRRSLGFRPGAIVREVFE